MKPLSERDENLYVWAIRQAIRVVVGMKPLSERDENIEWLEIEVEFLT